MAIQLHQHRVRGTPHHIYPLVSHLTTLPSKRFITLNNIDDHLYECVDVSLKYSAEWMISYIHHMNIHIAYCVNNDVLSDYPAEWKISYILHRKRGTLHCVQQMTFFPEWLLTLTTYIWIISTMYILIFLHHTSLTECSITRNTGIPPLLHMYQLCLFRTQCCLKALLQTPCEYDQSPLLMCSCSLRVLCWVNDLLHTSCSPLCMCWWYFRLVHWMKDLLQTSPTYRWSLPCIGKCCFSLWDHMNDLLHTSQWYGHSPLCVRWWSLRLICQLNDSLHTTHTYRYSMSRMCLCWFTVLSCL